MKIGYLTNFFAFEFYVGLVVSLSIAIASLHGAELGPIELRKGPTEKPQLTQNDLDEIRDKRQPVRDQTILKSHSYERENTVKYFKVLNDQLVSMEGLELILHDYQIVHSDLVEYNRALDTCGTNPGPKCDTQVQVLSKSVNEYFELVNFIGALKSRRRLTS